MDYFKVMRTFWDFAFENPEKIKPNHIAIFAFAVEHCNRLGWKEKFGFPTSMAMEATGIKSYSVYKKNLDDLINYGLIDIVEWSKNQWSSNIIALKENYKANDEANYKALDTAFAKHNENHSEEEVEKEDSFERLLQSKLESTYQSTYQSTCQSTCESTSSIIKQNTNNKLPITKGKNQKIEIPDFAEFLAFAKSEVPNVNEYSVKAKYESWIENKWHDGNNSPIIRWKSKLRNTLPHLKVDALPVDKIISAKTNQRLNLYPK
jgi:hypothetical protein